MKKLLSFLYSRPFMVALALVVQITVLVIIVLRFNRFFSSFYSIWSVISVIAVIYIVNGNKNPAYKMAWIIPILSIPIFGGLFYIMFGRNRMNKKIANAIATTSSRIYAAVAKDAEESARTLDNMGAVRPAAERQSQYIYQSGGLPPWEHTSVKYFSLGEYKWQAMLEELKKAEHFIFLEYFIIEEGIMWNSILDILKEKSAQGLDVRLMYDGLGSLFTLPEGYEKTMRSYGIQCHVFNPLVPSMDPLMNNRDHRKICVIDGHTGFNGGINLADEYINKKVKHGH